jgi:hypothetical protein
MAARTLRQPSATKKNSPPEFSRYRARRQRTCEPRPLFTFLSRLPLRQSLGANLVPVFARQLALIAAHPFKQKRFKPFLGLGASKQDVGIEQKAGHSLTGRPISVLDVLREIKPLRPRLGDQGGFDIGREVNGDGHT